jgi:hypothetical protein
VWGIDARLSVPGSFGRGRIGDKRFHVRRVDFSDADSGREFPCHEHLGQIRLRPLHHVGGLSVLLNVFFVDHHPGDLIEVDPVLRGENPSRPDTGVLRPIGSPKKVILRVRPELCIIC